MPKASPETLAELRRHDKDAFDFANNAVAHFFDRAVKEATAWTPLGFWQTQGSSKRRTEDQKPQAPISRWWVVHSISAPSVSQAQGMGPKPFARAAGTSGP